MMIRLQKYLSDSGVASRRKSEQMISDGLVSVNGIIATLGVKVDTEADTVAVNGEIIKKNIELIYIMLHKPKGYVTTVSDQFGRPAVVELLKGLETRVFPVGRLDYNTSGLLLLTNDGDLTYKLTHPKHNIEKVYIARVKGVPSAEEQAAFCGGIYIDGRKTVPAKMELINISEDEAYATVKITIREGRNRQVRKMLEEIGHNTVLLKRIATGRLFLGDLAQGEYRFLTKQEVEYLKKL